MKIAVIGAGVGGMTSALLLAKQGKQVTIYEKEAVLGGRLAYQGNGRYQIDQGPTIILLPDMLKEILTEAGIPGDALELISCEPLYDLHYSDGRTYTKYRDLPRQLEEIEKVFPGEGAHYLRYLSDMSEIFTIGVDSFLNKSFKTKRDFLTPENIKLLLQSRAYKSMKQFLASYFDHPKLQDAYALQSLYIGGSPLEAPALYGLVSYSEHAHGIWYLKGGYAGLTAILEKACLEQGVTIHREAKVEEILVEQNLCKGVKVNQTTYLYDAVVFNGDFPNLPGLIPDNKHVKKKDYTPSSGCVLIYLGVTKRFPEAKTHQFFMADSFDDHMEQVFKTKQVPEDPSFYVFNPVSIDEEAAPPNESVLYFLIPVPSGQEMDWDQIKDELVRKVIDKAETALFKGLREHIVWQDIRTPADSIKDGLYQGGSFGIAPILMQSGGFRPQVKPYKIDRLYSVGASVHPGGGVPIVMQGSRLLSQQIKKELG